MEHAFAIGAIEVYGRGSPFSSEPFRGRRAKSVHQHLILGGCARFSILLGIASGDSEIDVRK